MRNLKKIAKHKCTEIKFLADRMGSVRNRSFQRLILLNYLMWYDYRDPDNPLPLQHKLEKRMSGKGLSDSRINLVYELSITDIIEICHVSKRQAYEIQRTWRILED